MPRAGLYQTRKINSRFNALTRSNVNLFSVVGIRKLRYSLPQIFEIVYHIFLNVLVAQRIERSPPKRQVAGSILAEDDSPRKSHIPVPSDPKIRFLDLDRYIAFVRARQNSYLNRANVFLLK